MIFCHYVQGSLPAKNNIAGLEIVEPRVLFLGAFLTQDPS